MICGKRKTAPRRSLQNPIKCFDHAAERAVFFRFLRQPSRPNPPRPEAKSGRAAGIGVPAKETETELASPLGSNKA
jgi:hypothetical protein